VVQPFDEFDFAAGAVEFLETDTRAIELQAADGTGKMSAERAACWR